MKVPETTNDREQALIIGVGNEERGDDAVGYLVAGHLTARSIPGVAICKHSGDGTSLMDLWAGYKTVIIVDAVSAETRPGTIFKIDAHTASVSKSFFRSSTHLFGVAEAIELARSLRRLPRTLVVYGIQIKNTAWGSRISSEITRAARETAAMILSDLGLSS